MGKKILLALLIMTSTLMLSSCGSKNEVSSVESAEILYNTLLKDNFSNVDSIGVSNESLYKYIDDFDNELRISFRKIFENTGSSVTDKQVENILNAVKEGLAQTEFEVEESYSEGDFSTVKYSIYGLDLDSTIEALPQYFSDYEIKHIGGTDEELDQEITDKFIEFFIEKIKDGSTKKESAQIDIQFKKVDKLWSPSNLDEVKLIMDMAVYN